MEVGSIVLVCKRVNHFHHADAIVNGAGIFFISSKIIYHRLNHRLLNMPRMLEVMTLFISVFIPNNNIAASKERKRNDSFAADNNAFILCNTFSGAEIPNTDQKLHSFHLNRNAGLRPIGGKTTMPQLSIAALLNEKGKLHYAATGTSSHKLI